MSPKRHAEREAGNSPGSWDAEDYDERLGYVSEYGAAVVDLLDPKPGEKVLDLGCGTGELSAAISARGASVLGLDSSPEMVRCAASKYPEVSFVVGDGESFRFEEPFDAVFSNAALHWMKDARSVAGSVRLALRPGGRFAAEFGGRDNVGRVVREVYAALAERGVRAGERNPWYFPSVGEYASLLEDEGFRVRYAAHFDRPTRLDGEDGMAHWLEFFAAGFFVGFSPQERRGLIERVCSGLRPELYDGDGWTADYRRLRVLATREG